MQNTRLTLIEGTTDWGVPTVGMVPKDRLSIKLSAVASMLGG